MSVKTVNNRDPYLPREGANPHHIPFASLVRTTTTPFFCSHVWSCAAKASAIRGLSPTLFFFPYTVPDARLHVAIAIPPTFRSPDSHPVLQNVHIFLPISHPHSRTHPDAPGVLGSGCNWVRVLRAGSSGYLASFLGNEFLYPYYRC